MQFFSCQISQILGFKNVGEHLGSFGVPQFLSPRHKSHTNEILTYDFPIHYVVIFHVSLHVGAPHMGIPCIKAKTNGLGSFHVCLSALHSYTTRPSSIACVQHAAHRILCQHTQPVIINHHCGSWPAVRTACITLLYSMK